MELVLRLGKVKIDKIIFRFTELIIFSYTLNSVQFTRQLYIGTVVTVSLIKHLLQV
jgi:hypothetical protein